MSIPRRIPTLLTALAVLAVMYRPAGAQDRSDDDVLRLIHTIRASASAVTVDGSDGDWEAVPAIPDRRGDAGTDPGRDLAEVSLIPTDEVLLVRVATVGPPSRDDRAFWINVDVVGSRHADLQLGFARGGQHLVRRFERGAVQGLRRAPFPVAVGDVVEAALPFELLEALLPTDEPLRGEGSRSWIRVTALTWDRETDRILDYASAASFRIVPDPGPLDPPLPRSSGGPAATIPLPVEGFWYVSQGPWGYSTHADLWAYDLSRTDRGLAWSDPRDSCRNADYHAWGAAVSAPVGGRVIRSGNDRPDTNPCEQDGEGEGNHVYMDIGNDVGLWMDHFRRGSVRVEATEIVAAGQPLAQVGNSGASSGSHLHMSLFRLPEGRTTLPLAFRNVRVGLNPVDADPWARTMEVWEPREGFYVARAEAR